jgi:hypothetical protein
MADKDAQLRRRPARGQQEKEMRRNNDPVVITTLGQRVGGPPRRPRIGLGGAIAAGLGVLFLYAIVSLIFHAIVATALWLPAIIVAGYASAFAARRGIQGFPRLAIGIVVLIAVRAALLAL